MKDKTLIIKQGREYFARGGLDGVYKKLYAYEQIAGKPEKVIAVEEVLEIIESVSDDWIEDNCEWDWHGEMKSRVLSLHGKQE